MNLKFFKQQEQTVLQIEQQAFILEKMTIPQWFEALNIYSSCLSSFDFNTEGSFNKFVKLSFNEKTYKIDSMEFTSIFNTIEDKPNIVFCLSIDFIVENKIIHLYIQARNGYEVEIVNFHHNKSFIDDFVDLDFDAFLKENKLIEIDG